MPKRGQISIFIIIGLTILIVVGSVILVSNYLSEEELKVHVEKSEFDPGSVRNFVESCFQETSKEVMLLISLQGGYFYTPKPSSDQIFAHIPYYFDYGEKRIPTIEDIEKNMEDFLITQLPICFKDFYIFTEQGYDVKKGEMDVKVHLGKASVFELDYPLTINLGDEVSTVNELYIYDIPVNFENVYSIITDIVNEQELNSNYVPIGYISASAKQNDYEFELSYLDDDVVVYSLIFGEYLLDLGEYTFIFGCRYNWSHLITVESVPEITVEDQYCYVEDSCYYNLNIYDEDLTFEDYTELFDISEDGRIEFIPKEIDVGNQTILVKVSTQEGAEEYLSFNLEIKRLEFENEE